MASYNIGLTTMYGVKKWKDKLTLLMASSESEGPSQMTDIRVI
jgi:hypothetical protein